MRDFIMPGPGQKVCDYCRGCGYTQDEVCDSHGYWNKVGPKKRCKICGGCGIVNQTEDEKPESLESWFSKKMKKW